VGSQPGLSGTADGFDKETAVSREDLNAAQDVVRRSTSERNSARALEPQTQREWK